MDQDPTNSEASGEKRCFKRCLIPMLLIVLINAGVQLSFQDVIHVGEGFGWDGVLYGELAMNPERFDELLATQAGERRQRVLPSMIVSALIGPFGEPDHESVILGFQVLNTLCIGFAVFVWVGIAKRKQFSVKGAWLGFIALFLNYQNMKFTYYDPILTDSMTLLFAMLVYWSWVRESRLGLALSLFLGSFCSSSILLLSIPLLIFKKQALDPGTKRWSVVGALIVSGGLLAILLDVAFRQNYQVPEGWRPPAKELYPLSILISVAYIFLGARFLLAGRVTLSWGELQNRIHWSGLLIVAALQALILFIIHQWPFDSGGPGFLETFAIGPNSIPFRSLNLPFVFGLAHLFYWGPAYLLLLYYWRAICKDCHNSGLGLTLYVFAFLLLSLSYETRHLIVFMPILVGGLVKSMEREEIGWPFYLCFLLGSLGLSRFWLIIESPNLRPQLSSLWPG